MVGKTWLYALIYLSLKVVWDYDVWSWYTTWCITSVARNWEVLALSKTYCPRREHYGASSQEKKKKCFSAVITGLQKPGLRYIHTMTSLCQQRCELRINELPWNLLQHHSNGTGDGLKTVFGPCNKIWVKWKFTYKKDTRLLTRAQLRCLSTESKCGIKWSRP